MLDFGCGDGSFIKSLLNSDVNAEYFGTGISETMITMASTRLKSPHVNFLVSDGFNMSFSKNLRCDLIHLDSVIHHIIGKSISETRL